LKKVLIIDDEQDVLNVLGRRLADQGYRVFKASDGPDGIEKAEQEKPDLIILDVWMPGMDGGEVAQKLRQNEKTKNIPVIFLTCLYTRSDEAQTGHEPGKNFILAKPYHPDDLLEAVREHLT